MELFVVVLHIFLCLFLMAVVLLQPGKTDMGAAFGGGGGNAMASAQSGVSLLGKITTAVAFMFMMTSLTLAWFSNASLTSDSVMEDLEVEAAAPEPAPAPEKAAAPPPPAPAPQEAAPAEPAGGSEAAPAQEAPAGGDGGDDDGGSE